MIKVYFEDFWPGFESNNLFLKFLEKHYDISIDRNPDYLFYSVYGNSHLNYKDCVKILYTGENLVPDFNCCDYAMGFHYMDFGDRYLRFPLYVYYQWFYSGLYNSLRAKPCSSIESTDEELLQRKFCNFIYSNGINSDPTRDIFFQELNKYKKIDSGGRHLNNIGISIADKLSFIKDYKFTIAFENSSVPGYTTEKLLEPIMMKSLPIYYGNPLVHMDFNVNSLIQVRGINDFERAIEEIIYLDKNNDLYLKKLKQYKFANNNSLQAWEDKLLIFMNNILNKPISSAIRRPGFGFAKFYIEEIKLQSELLNKNKRRNQYKQKIKSIINRLITIK